MEHGPSSGQGLGQLFEHLALGLLELALQFRHLGQMPESECLEGWDTRDKLDSVNGSDEAVLFEEDSADPFQPDEEAGLRRTPRDLSTEGA